MLAGTIEKVTFDKKVKSNDLVIDFLERYNTCRVYKYSLPTKENLKSFIRY